MVLMAAVLRHKPTTASAPGAEPEEALFALERKVLFVG